VTLEGRVSSVVADQMEITTPEGTSTFGWQGPALDTAFAVDELVQIDVAFGPQPLGPPKVSIVRSARATAVTVDGSTYGGFGKESDASTTTALGLGRTLPRLAYSTVSCCATSRVNWSNRDDYTCDASALQAHFEGSSSAIARGTTGVVGPWSVTNILSSFTHSDETYASIEVTLLGPGTPRGADAGI
jgi:hypothetical protein